MKVDVSRFAAVPRSDVPRSRFSMTRNLKTAFDAGTLYPMFCEEVLPGDTWRVNVSQFVRLATPIFPVMDNLYVDMHFFYVPLRIIWSNFKKFMGEQDSPGDSTSYTIPQSVSPASGYAIGTLQDYFGLPTAGQVAGGATVSHSSLPLRAYNKIYNAWYRDENLCTPVTESVSDGPDVYTLFTLKKRGKRHDYFTSALPWPQKSGTSVPLPLGTTAPVAPWGSENTGMTSGWGNSMLMRYNAGGAAVTGVTLAVGTGAVGSGPAGAFGAAAYPSNLVADLSGATAATINQLRQAITVQQLLEKDARGGTRYNEMVLAHFGVRPPDYRVQRPEYLGGGTGQVGINSVPQTSGTGVTGGTTPLGNLAAFGTMLKHGIGFSQSFTEHGYIIGIVSVRADLTYQQGMRRHWSRSTRYDYYDPVFANLGEQSILNKEIYCRGDANDALVFGYQERWAEYRYLPSEITGLMRSTATSTIDPWHLAQKFTSLPTLGATFIEESPPVDRVLAVGSGAAGQQFLADFFFEVSAVRPLPMYSVPGLDKL